MRGALPFLGLALPFGRDAMGLLERERERHGDVFTLFIGGQRMTFIADPMSVPAVLKAKRLRFAPIADEVADKAFGIPKIRELAAMEALERTAKDYLKGRYLGSMTVRMETELRALLPSFVKGRERLELYRFIWDLMFAAGARAVFGTGKDTPAIAEAFETFDREFPLMVAGAPSFMVKRGEAALVELSRELSSFADDASGWLNEREALLGDQDPLDRGRLQTTILWAAQANTIPACYWSLAYLLRHPEARAAVLRELEGVDTRDLEPDKLGELRMLDSAIREALRLSTGSLTIRRVMEDFVLETPVGDHALREGDRVCLAPFLFHHDPAIFPEPHRYIHDRFYVAEGVKQFFKQGKRVPIPLMPFGAGVSMCPGRFFALNEIKLFVALILTQLDLELVDPEAELPGFDHSRVGLGIYPPATGLDVKLRA